MMGQEVMGQKEIGLMEQEVMEQFKIFLNNASEIVQKYGVSKEQAEEVIVWIIFGDFKKFMKNHTQETEN